jgi:hypothetical protein
MTCMQMPAAKHLSMDVPPRAAAQLSGAQSALSRMRALLEVAIVYGLIEAALWTEGLARQLWSWTALLLILLLLAVERARPRDLGFRAGRPRAWWICPLAALAGTCILLAGAMVGTLHPLYGYVAVLPHTLGYAIWTVVQQFIAQGFFFRRFERLLGGGIRAVAANALLFGAAHWPNPVLVPVTLVGGFILTELFRRYRTIFPLAVAQTLVALSIAMAVPNHLHHHMRVGIGYETYRSAPQRALHPTPAAPATPKPLAAPAPLPTSPSQAQSARQQ